MSSDSDPFGPLFEDAKPWLGPLSGTSALMSALVLAIGQGHALSIFVGCLLAFIAIASWLEWRLRSALDAHFTRSSTPLNELVAQRSAALDAWREDRSDDAAQAAAQDAALNAFLDSTRPMLQSPALDATEAATQPTQPALAAAADSRPARKPTRQVEKTVPLEDEDLQFLNKPKLSLSPKKKTDSTPSAETPHTEEQSEATSHTSQEEVAAADAPPQDAPPQDAPPQDAPRSEGEVEAPPEKSAV